MLLHIPFTQLVSSHNGESRNKIKAKARDLLIKGCGHKQFYKMALLIAYYPCNNFRDQGSTAISRYWGRSSTMAFNVSHSWRYLRMSHRRPLYPTLHWHVSGPFAVETHCPEMQLDAWHDLVTEPEEEKIEHTQLSCFTVHKLSFTTLEMLQFAGEGIVNSGLPEQ